MSALGLGLIGCGGMGKSLIKGAHASGLGKLIVACDMDAERAQQAAEEFDCASCNDMNDVFGRSDIDALVIATPNFAHCDCVLAAAQSGKPIFCEKPMALSTADCDRMIAACKASGSGLMIGQVLRYIGVFDKAIELVREGAIGEPFGIHVARMSLSDPSKQAPWRHDINKSGGTLFEFGVHEIDFIGCICGQAKSVFATGSNFLHQGQYNFPDHIFLTIDFVNGAKGMYANGAASAIPWNETRVWGAEGAITLTSWGGKLQLKRSSDAEPQAVDIGSREPHVQREVREFLESARDGSPMTIPGETGRANVAIAEAGLKSIQTGQVVAVA